MGAKLYVNAAETSSYTFLLFIYKEIDGNRDPFRSGNLHP
jgi:hypothetical protein